MMWIKRMAPRAAGLVRPLVSLVMPETCWGTGEPLHEDEQALSEVARRQIAAALLGSYCGQCGLTAAPDSRYDAGNPCPKCSTRDLGLERIVRVGTFVEPLSVLVKTLKFHRRWEVARVIAPFIVQAMHLATHDQRLAPVDLLVPVALHWRRQWQRGFNQSEEIAREVGRLGHWPVGNYLWRRRATLEQSHTQSATQRRANLRAAFLCSRPERVAGKHVWLMDDVCTTGATLHAAAMALRRLPKGQRPAGIYAAVLCVTDHTPLPLQEGAAGEDA
ncbi:MAG: hypothetical protein WCI73_18940 [Phycisphaerae bacterium]